MSKTKKPRNKKMSQAKKEKLQSTSFENNQFSTMGTQGQGPNLKINNTNRAATKMIRGASRGS
jgi:hypothetical protein